jgi:HTH-type transcriptional regulator / antitoxin HipB
MNVVVKNTNEIGILIQETRKKLKLTQIEVASAAGIGTRLLVEIEKGKSTVQIGKLLQVLDVLGFEIRLSDE